ncbi:ParB/RepB/Spo0J family partition protein [Phenylobacterium sp.]|uniref:ParB/RepB/Spo0J family partition protein n=1 Tax=Phenylobacterium sp. TaxID=1871053 RepID=UPI0035AF593A
MNGPINAPAPAEANGGLTPFALSHADTLRHLAAHPAATHLEIAAATGRAASNVKRDLIKLADVGVVDRGRILTDVGRRIVESLRRLDDDAPPAGEGLMIAHHHLRPNPLNPRGKGSLGDLAALADTIEAAGGILQNLVVYPPDAEGVHTIAAGERRWRAVGRLIGQGRWPADRPLPCVQREFDEVQTHFIALVENGQRQNLSIIEEARAYAALVEAQGWSARQAALSTGRDPRTVQEMLKVLREATPEAIRWCEEGRLTWEELRGLVRTPQAPATPAAEPEQIDIEEVAPAPMTGAMELGLIELAWKIATSPVDGLMGEPAASTNGYSYMSQVWRALSNAGLICEEMPSPYGRRCCVTWLTPAGRERLAALWPDGVTEDAVRAVRERVGYPEGHTPGAGEDLGYHTYVLNTRISDTAQRSARRIWLEPTPAERLVLVEVAHKVQRAPLGGRTGAGKVRGPENGDWDDAVRNLSFVSLLQISYEHGRQVALVPVAGLVRLRQLGFDLAADADGALRRAWSEAGVSADEQDELCSGSRYVTDWLNDGASKAAPAERPGLTGDAFSQQVREALGEPSGAEVPNENAHLADFPPEVTEVWAPDEEELAYDAAMLRLVEARHLVNAWAKAGAYRFPPTSPSAPAEGVFATILERMGLRGPFTAPSGPMAGAVMDSSWNEVCTVDVNRTLPDPAAEATATLIAAALNICAGFKLAELRDPDDVVTGEAAA